MTDVVSFNKERAERKHDSRLWTPLDALKDLVAEIEAGKIKVDKIAIHFLEPTEDGGYRHHYNCANMTHESHLAVLAIAQRKALDDWIR